jgi:hypothetical protein
VCPGEYWNFNTQQIIMQFQKFTLYDPGSDHPSLFFGIENIQKPSLQISISSVQISSTTTAGYSAQLGLLQQVNASYLLDFNLMALPRLAAQL